ATGERSSRVIERRCREDVAVRVICAGVCPDQATIARFRRRHAEALIGLFGRVLALWRLAGLGRLGTIAIDGTKVRADASKQRYPGEERAGRVLAEAEARDAAGDELADDEQEALRGSGGLGGASERRARFAGSGNAGGGRGRGAAGGERQAIEQGEGAAARRSPRAGAEPDRSGE